MGIFYSFEHPLHLRQTCINSISGVSNQAEGGLNGTRHTRPFSWKRPFIFRNAGIRQARPCSSDRPKVDLAASEARPENMKARRFQRLKTAPKVASSQ
jgi:hypothetical protein